MTAPAPTADDHPPPAICPVCGANQVLDASRCDACGFSTTSQKGPQEPRVRWDRWWDVLDTVLIYLPTIIGVTLNAALSWWIFLLLAC